MLLDWIRQDKSKFDSPADVAALVEIYRKDLVTILNGGFNLGENSTSKFIALDFVHGVETPFANPLKVRPRGFIPLNAENVDLSVPGSPRLLGVLQPALPQVSPINFSRSDGLLGLTAQYAAPRCSVLVARTSNGAAIPDNTEADTVWSGVITGSSSYPVANGVYTGTDITWNPASPAGLTVNTAGRYRISSHAALSQNGVGSRGHYIKLFGSRYGSTEGAGSVSSFWQTRDFIEQDLVAGTTIQQGMAVLGAGVGTITPIGAGSLAVPGGNRCEMQVTAIAPDPTTSARVTGILVGG